MGLYYKTDKNCQPGLGRQDGMEGLVLTVEAQSYETVPFLYMDATDTNREGVENTRGAVRVGQYETAVKDLL